jgi:hypothetical protein
MLQTVFQEKCAASLKPHGVAFKKKTSGRSRRTIWVDTPEQAGLDMELLNT